MIERTHLPIRVDTTAQTAPYRELSPEQYRIFLRYRNLEFLDGLRVALTGVPLKDDQCLVVVGSDGKQERHKQSKTDMVIIGTPGAGIEDAQRIKLWYQERRPGRVFENDFDLPGDQLPQVSVIGDHESPMSYAYPHIYRRPSRIYPDRILNAQVVAGNSEVYLDARRQVLHEMSDNNQQSHRIRRDMTVQLKQYRQACETGHYRERAIFTVDPPMQFYDEDPASYRTGFKLAFLRLVQRHLDIVTTTAIRTGAVSIDQLVTDLPTSTYDRVSFFMKKGILCDDSLTMRARDAYMWFMQQYHFAQEIYKSTRAPVALPFDFSQYARHGEVIRNFTST